MLFRCLPAILASIIMAIGTPTLAQGSRSNGVVSIGNDRGGAVRARLVELNRLQSNAQSVRIVGDYCYSTCTMYLGLPQTCVSRDTIFGFHGPSRSGRPLDPALFDYASRVIAHHYPAAIKEWYLSTGRYETRGLFKMRGAELIRHGVKECGRAG